MMCILKALYVSLHILVWRSMCMAMGMSMRCFLSNDPSMLFLGSFFPNLRHELIIREGLNPIDHASSSWAAYVLIKLMRMIILAFIGIT